MNAAEFFRQVEFGTASESPHAVLWQDALRYGNELADERDRLLASLEREQQENIRLKEKLLRDGKRKKKRRVECEGEQTP